MIEYDTKVMERRRSRRARLKLRGRYMLSDGREHPCETIDVSVTGVALSAYVVAELGERVVAYMDELGRIEGVVVRRGNGWFAIEAKIPQGRIDRYAQKLADLSGDGEIYNLGALASQTRPAELRTEFGQSFAVRVCDQNRFSVKVLADFKLLPGARVTVDQRSAVVVRDAVDGFLVAFA